MSVMPDYDKFSAFMWDEDLVGKPCFNCGRPLTAPLVSWHGCALLESDDGRLGLHAECVLSLANGLLRDAEEIFRKAESLFAYDRRTRVAGDHGRLCELARAIGAALRAAEPYVIDRPAITH